MVEIHDVAVQIMDIEFFFEEWDEDDSAELLEDDNSCLLKPTSLLFLVNAFISLCYSS